ncbi:MAG: NAD(P)H-dependent oxidoreductase [Flavobacteriaceae bacterium]|nr:NAD(P)H-dependent oxidoreductase [Flavobacteriaceae bacterium]
MKKVIDSLKWRYATKKFDSTKLLSVEKIDTIKHAFNLTATSYGLQPVKLVIFSNKKLQERLVKYTMDQIQLSQASHVLVFCIETNIDKEFIGNYFNRVKQVRNTSEAILNPFKDFLINDFEQKTQKQIEDWATKQAYLTMGNLMTVCAFENIDACPMEGFLPEKYDEILQLNKQGLKSVLVMPIGYRANDDMFADFKKVRKELNNSVIEK